MSRCVRPIEKREACVSWSGRATKMAERKVMTEIWESLGHVTFHRPQGKRGQPEAVWDL